MRLSRARSTPLALALSLLALGLGACASPGTPEAGSASTASFGTWHDPDFYAPWHDPAAVVLPPPPFTGFKANGQTSPMLPTRPRPVGAGQP